MIAQVYPVRRMPRGMDVFDYNTQSGVSVGDIVEINFKGRDILGIVATLAQKKTENTSRTKDIQKIVYPAYFTKKDIERIEIIARNIHASPSTIFTAILQGTPSKLIQSKKILRTPQTIRQSVHKAEAETIQKLLQSKHTHLSAELSSEGEIILASLLVQKNQGQTLLLLPRENMLREVQKHLLNTEILYGKTSKNERARIMHGWRTGEIQVLAGLQQAALLPAKNIKHLLVFDAGAFEYAIGNRSPKIDTRAAAKILAKQHNANIYFCTRLTRVEELMDEDYEVHTQETENINLINQKLLEEKTALQVLSKTAEHILQTEQGKIVCIYNKIGTAKKLQCRACNHIPTCGTCGDIPEVRKDDLKCKTCSAEMWIPKICPSCRSPKLTEKGVGNKRVLDYIQKLIPHKKVQLFDKQTQGSTEADILVVTEYFIKNNTNAFKEKTYTVIIDLLFDLALLGSDFRSQEQAAYKLRNLAFFARKQGAKLYIQTYLPEEIQAMIQHTSFIKNQLNQRKNYELPPVVNEYNILDKTTKKRYKETLIDAHKPTKNLSITPDIAKYE